MSEALALLAELGAEARLSAAIEPFAGAPTFAERLAENPFLMAPMAGVSDAAWRLMARAGGAGAAYTEMVSVAGLHYASERIWELVVPDDGEPDIAVQLFGADPALFEEAARSVAERLGERLAFLDVNMACPVPKVTRKGEGVALMDDAPRAEAIIRACVRGLEEAGSKAPVSAKIRLGRSPRAFTAPDLSRALEGAGASAVAVHGRYGTQLYLGSSDDGAIARVASAVGIPVLASGDVSSAERAVALLRASGAAGVLVARGSYGNPWIFGQARSLASGEAPADPTADERICAWELHVRLLEATGAHMLKARQISCHYLRGLPGAASWRREAMGLQTAGEFLSLAERVRAAVARGERA